MMMGLICVPFRLVGGLILTRFLQATSELQFKPAGAQHHTSIGCVPNCVAQQPQRIFDALP